MYETTYVMARGSTPDLRNFTGQVILGLSAPFLKPRHERTFGINIREGRIVVEEAGTLVLDVPEAILNPLFDTTSRGIDFSNPEWVALGEAERELARLLLYGAFQLIMHNYGRISADTSRVLQSTTLESLRTLALPPVRIAS